MTPHFITLRVDGKPYYLNLAQVQSVSYDTYEKQPILRVQFSGGASRSIKDPASMERLEERLAMLEEHACIILR
jgi:hypothetical protein